VLYLWTNIQLDGGNFCVLKLFNIASMFCITCALVAIATYATCF
jgi:hypothetical protein